MTRPSLSILLCCAVLLAAVLPAAAQNADLVMGTIPISADANETLYAAAGLIGDAGFTLDWVTGPDTAHGVFLGTAPGAGEQPPHFALAWYDIPAGLPLQVSIVSGTGSEYSFSCSWGSAEGEPDGTVGDGSIVGDYQFSYAVPQAEAMAVHVVLVSESADWDLAVHLAWAEGLPTEAASWGEVKALYR